MKNNIYIKMIEKILLFNLNSILKIKIIPDLKLIDKKDIIHNIIIEKDFYIKIIKNEITDIINNKNIKSRLKYINTIELYLCDDLLDKNYIMKMIFKIKNNNIIYYKFKQEKTDIINNKLKEIYKEYIYYRCDIY